MTSSWILISFIKSLNAFGQSMFLNTQGKSSTDLQLEPSNCQVQNKLARPCKRGIRNMLCLATSNTIACKHHALRRAPTPAHTQTGILCFLARNPSCNTLSGVHISTQSIVQHALRRSHKHAIHRATRSPASSHQHAIHRATRTPAFSSARNPIVQHALRRVSLCVYML